MGESPIQRYLLTLLRQAQEDHATIVVIAPVKGSKVPIRYKAGDKWLTLAPPPAGMRPSLVTELSRLAGLPGGKFPKDGAIDVTSGDGRVHWRVQIASVKAECVLTPLAASPAQEEPQ